MRAKTTTVTLVAGGVTRDFELSHAERLLRLPRGSWKLPENSEFEFVDNALRYRADKKGDSGK